MTGADKHTKQTGTGLEIAIIGMAGRFPGAENIARFWENLKNSVESISFFSDEELREAGMDPRLLDNPNYVKARGFLEDVEYFDSSFFGYMPAEVEIMDPQVRIFHECAWQALEDAGYVPDSYKGLIGLYAGAGDNFYWQGLRALAGNGTNGSGVSGAGLDTFSTAILRNKDYLATRVSYKLDLKGPGVFVQTACSTSLVAVDSACRALLTGVCDMALAGGVTLVYPRKGGYLYQEGLIFSRDGHCKVFDAKASGTVPGEGAAIVVLKRLEDAETDGDHIYAVIKGFAVNNDGMGKFGFTAPGVDGQAKVIREAHRMAMVNPEEIGYIETHGTGTDMGDSIEIEGLKLAFNMDKKHFCAIGALKSNVGHMDTAAGAAALIKTALILKHGIIPPSLFYENPNPQIDFENSPFYVNTELKEWKRDKKPLLAGVSAFGIGGTNAHVVLEQWGGNRGDHKGREFKLLLLSARTPSALDKMTENLGDYLKNNPVKHSLNLADAAYILQVGRKAFPYRRMVVCRDAGEAIEALNAPGSGRSHLFLATPGQQPVIFMFSGQGSQYVNMGLDLYRTEPVFKEELDHCFDILKSIMGEEVKQVLYPGEAPSEKEREKINQFVYTSPLKFSFEYSLARLLMKWGIRPYAMIGHSFGEYTAACLAGVFSLEHGLRLAALRGRLMHRMPEGAMLSVPLPEERLKTMLNENISLAAVNGASLCIVSGPIDAIAAFENRLNSEGHECVRLRVPRAAHSPMTEPILKEFRQEVAGLQFNKPQIPYISTLTGKWATASETTDPTYWTRHMRETVRFADGLAELLKEKNAVFVQVGSDRSLTSFVELHPDRKDDYHPVITLVRHPKDEVADHCFLLDKLGILWLYGVTPDWSAFYRGERCHRVPLPTYPFEGRRFSLEGNLSQIGPKTLAEYTDMARKPNMADWFYVPLWEQSPLPPIPAAGETAAQRWLVFADGGTLSGRLVKKLEDHGHEVVTVGIGTEFHQGGEQQYQLDPTQDDHYQRLFHQLSQTGKIPQRILHLWHNSDSHEADITGMLDRGFYCLLNSVRAVNEKENIEALQLDVVTAGLHAVTGEEEIKPEIAAVLGVLESIKWEYPEFRCRAVDVLLPPPGGRRGEEKLVEDLWQEFSSEVPGPINIAAWRGKHRWTQRLKPYPLESKGDPKQHLQEGGVYLVTGGLGGMGLTFACHLAKDFKARLVLVGRSPFPPEEQWEHWLKSHEEGDPVSIKIRELREMQQSGAEILVASADAADLEAMRRVMTRCVQRFGPINGVIHTAGVADYGGVIQQRSRQTTDPVLAPKIQGTRILERLLKEMDMDPDFVILCSSLSTVLVPGGEVGYVAANAFLDAFAQYKAHHNPGTWLSVDWGVWQQVGMGPEAARRKGRDPEKTLQDEILPSEGIDILHHLLEHRRHITRAAVVPRDLEGLQRWLEQENSKAVSADSPPGDESVELAAFSRRPSLKTAYAAPRDALEQTLANIWQRLFCFQEVGIHDDFFELGGDSLKGMMFINQYKRLVGENIPISTIFNAPTIAQLTDFFTRQYPHAAARIRLGDITPEKSRYTSVQPAEKKEFYALSSTQERLYFLQQMDPESSGYNISPAMVLKGDLDRGKLAESFKHLIRRHENLRTAFTIVDEKPVQRIYDQVAFEIEYLNAKQIQNQDVQNVKHFIRPFDLSRPPLLRVGLLEMAGTKHLLMVDMHHIISDGLSQHVLQEDFLAFFHGEELPVLSLHYKDYVEWQRQEEQAGTIGQQEAYWLKHFKPPLPVLNLPTDFPRPGSREFEGAAVYFSIEKTVYSALRAFALQEGVTFQILLTAVFHILLTKISGQEDIITGTTIAGRGHEDLEKIIGLFANTLAIRDFPTAGKTFKQFLQEVKENSLKAYQNQDYPFENLVRQVVTRQDMSRNPLFDVMFEIRPPFTQTKEKYQPDTGELEAYPFEPEIEITKFDQDWMGMERSDRIDFTVTYSTKLFRKETVELMADQFLVLIENVLNNADSKIKDLDHRAPVEKELKEVQDFTFNF